MQESTPPCGGAGFPGMRNEAGSADGAEAQGFRYARRRIKRGEGLGRNLAKGRNYGRVGGRNPRTKRCYAYNILHFRLFLPYRRPCRFVFFPSGLRADGLRRRGGPARGGQRRTRCGEKPTGPTCRRTGIGKMASLHGTAGISTEKPRPTANATICMR